MTHRSRLRVLLTIFALVAGAAGTGGYFIPNPERTWPDGTIEVHEQLTGGPAGTLLDGSSSLNVAFEQAVQTWNQYLGRIQFVPIRNSTAAIGDGNDVNNVIMSDTVFGRAFGDQALAVTSRWFDTRTNRRTEFDIVFNSKWNWNSYRGALRTGLEDIVRVGLHQLGQAIGLSRPDDDGQNVAAIMNSNVSDLDTLTFDDVSGAISLYGAADPAPGTFRHIKVTTDGTGTATFTLSADRTVPVRFVDHATGAGIAGADAYLFTEPNGVAMAGLSDPRGRYFTQLAPIRLPVTVTTASAADVRPIEVPVPLVDPATAPRAPTPMFDWISHNVVGSAWSDTQRRAINLMNDLKGAQVIVDREMKLSEIAEEVDIWQEMVDRGLDNEGSPAAVEITFDTLRTSFSQAVWKQFNPIDLADLVDDTPYGKAVEARDRFWQASQMTLGFAGYGPNQKFRMRVVRLPIDVPEEARKYTEWQIYASALEDPEKPWIPNAQAGVITGYLVDATTGRPVHGVVTLTGPDPRIYTNGLGYFASKPVPPGFYYVNGGATGYRENRASVTVQGDGKIESVTIALVPLGIKEVVVTPAAQTIRDNQATSVRATVNGMDGAPYLPAPRVEWYSDNPTVATVERDTGNVRGVKAGRAFVVASTADGHRGIGTIVVERSGPCPLTLSSRAFTATDAGGAANVTVTTEADCAWTAVPSPTSMMSIVSGGSATGTGTFRFAVSRNTSTSSRTGTVTIQGMPAPNTVTVTQSGTAPACTITLSRTGVSVNANANTGLSVGVTADAGCTWTATASGFITITSGSSGSGPGTVIFSVTANTGAARTATLSINGQTVTVSQAAGTSTPVTTWSLRGTGCDRSAGDLPGWINCRSVLDITITATNQSGYVSAIYAYPDSGSFYHGDVQVTRGAAPGSIRINLVNNYVPRCVTSLATTLTIRDGPQSATSAPTIAVIPFTYTNTCG